MIDETFEPQCKLCGCSYSAERLSIGYAICMPCGDDLANKTRHTIVPMAKSNYIVVTDLTLLKGLNKYANS
jgi:ribosomal protein L37AE/L43A